ncbi:MAG: PadR family transcriptional regulator [Azospira oryzae]|jgi:PadR family transcriptional regulator PadR|nr:MAG: PadR family transcriptional regulator [Azospira oryzae]
MKRVYLGEFEEIVLLLVASLKGEAYGVNITHEIMEQTEREVRLNQVHASLQRLEEKGMITSRMSEPVAERGGRRKRLFKITAYGKQTLNDIKTVRTHLWSLLPSSI